MPARIREAKSRTTRPATSVYDIHIGDHIIILNDDGSKTDKFVTTFDIDSNSVTVADLNGQGQQTITLDFNNPAKTGSGEFRYWLDESKGEPMTRPTGSTRRKPVREDAMDMDDMDMSMMDGPPVDDVLGADVDDDVEFGGDGISDPDGDYGDDLDLDASLDDEFDDFSDEGSADGDIGDDDDFDDDDAGDDFMESEEGTQLPDTTIDGGVDDSADEDGEGVEDVGIEAADEDNAGLKTMVDDDWHNDQGEAPEDESDMHGEVGGVQPNNSSVLPGGKMESQIRKQVREALSRVESGTNPVEIAPLLLRGNNFRSLTT